MLRCRAVNILSPIIDTAGMCGDNEVKCCSGNKNSVSQDPREWTICAASYLR
jgi:hypothetical protein